MSGMFAAQKAPQAPKSTFQKFKESPLYTIVLNGGLFVAGVAFIQSPLMDMMAPQAYNIPGKYAQIVRIMSMTNSVPNPLDKNADTGGKKMAEGES
ncbi:hypothetical protein ZYGM_000130 [Zygosaccharomyces mellis]|uniref:Uncharacterized protein n=1 Tax=Zygosaccharomyces mellis TaxID=42258 RepID=A0A4C2EBJ4_9SACH|nr:hypothetical protein ZYGM_000130 [Zygosaccharomyces mellis]